MTNSTICIGLIQHGLVSGIIVFGEIQRGAGIEHMGQRGTTARDLNFLGSAINNIHLISSLKRKELSHYQFVTNAGVGGQR